MNRGQCPRHQYRQTPVGLAGVYGVALLRLAQPCQRWPCRLCQGTGGPKYNNVATAALGCAFLIQMAIGTSSASTARRKCPGSGDICAIIAWPHRQAGLAQTGSISATHYEPFNPVYVKRIRISSYGLIFCAIASVIKVFDMLWSERPRILFIW